MRSLLRLLAVLAVVAATSGCVTKPRMEVHAARIQQIQGTGVVLSLTMRVENDNRFDIMVRNVRADVTLAERYRLPTIITSPNQWIRSNSVAFVQVPVLVPWPMVAPLVQTTVGSMQISYRAEGMADVTATQALGIEVDNYELQEEGMVSRAELIAAAGRGFGG